jgi:AraC-like DNA-binding protein
MNMPSSSKALFYSSDERSLFLLRLDEFYSRVTGPSMMIISLDKQLEVLDIEGDSHLSYTLLIPAGTPVTIKTNRAKVAICFLKSTGSDVKKLIPLMANHIKIDGQYTLSSKVRYEKLIREQAKEVWQDTPKASDVLRLLEKSINAFDGLHDKTINYEADARVVKVIDMIKENCTVNVSVGDMAKAVGLSVARLSQLFRATTGTSIRNFRLWERVFYTVRCLQSGMSLTDAAVMAGFSDYAQCFRAYKELGGCHPGKTKSRTDVKVAA